MTDVLPVLFFIVWFGVLAFGIVLLVTGWREGRARRRSRGEGSTGESFSSWSETDGGRASGGGDDDSSAAFTGGGGGFGGGGASGSGDWGGSDSGGSDGGGGDGGGGGD